MKVKIRRWGINGEGIAYVNKKAIFVEGAIPGEVVDIIIDEDKGTYATGHINRILESAPRRREPICPHWQTCGGCSLMHVDYKGQIRMKEHAIEEALRRYADYSGKIEPMIKNPDPLGYRNACKLPFGLDEEGKTTTGMFKKGSNEFVPLDRCIIHSKKLEHVRAALMPLIQQAGLKPFTKDHPEGLMTLVLKEFDGKVHVVFVTTEMEIPQSLVDQILETIPETASVWQSIKEPDDPGYELFGQKVLHLGGDMKMTLQLDDFALDLLPKSFFQLNTRQAVNLYKTIASWIPPHSDFLVEAYSGIGAISLFVADKADKVLGIEYIEDAVANANENALINGKENVSFICGDAGQEMTKLEKSKIDTLIVDPPRSGLNTQMKEAILKSEPKTLIYVSCNPSTLGKDLAVLQSKYEIERVQPFDFFSQTPHVETACLLKLKAPEDFTPVNLEREKPTRPKTGSPADRNNRRPAGKDNRRPGRKDNYHSAGKKPYPPRNRSPKAR